MIAMSLSYLVFLSSLPLFITLKSKKGKIDLLLDADPQDASDPFFSPYLSLQTLILLIYWLCFPFFVVLFYQAFLTAQSTEGLFFTLFWLFPLTALVAFFGNQKSQKDSN
jgi:hypothetical protein